MYTYLSQNWWPSLFIVSLSKSLHLICRLLQFLIAESGLWSLGFTLLHFFADIWNPVIYLIFFTFKHLEGLWSWPFPFFLSHWIGSKATWNYGYVSRLIQGFPGVSTDIIIKHLSQWFFTLAQHHYSFSSWCQTSINAHICSNKISIFISWLCTRTDQEYAPSHMITPLSKLWLAPDIFRLANTVHLQTKMQKPIYHLTRCRKWLWKHPTPFG